MVTRKRHSEATKLSVVMAAEMVGVTAAAEAAGVPHQTVSYWMEKPEFSEYRRKAREDLKDEITVVAHLAWQRVAEGLHKGVLEPRDALFAAEKATTQYLLLSGEATSRTETRTFTDDLSDDEQERLRNWILALPVSEAVPG